MRCANSSRRCTRSRPGQGGRLSVGAVSTAKYFAPRLIAAFLARHPKLELRFLIGNRAQTIDWLRAMDVEIALAGRPPADMPIAKVALGPHPYVMIAPPGHRLAGAGRIARQQLAGEAFLFREPGSGTRSLFEYFIGDTEIRRVQLGMELGSNETIKQAVMAGLGIALISAHTIAAELADGRLACLDVEGLPIVRQWFVVHRTDRPLSPAASAFRDFAEAHGAEFLPQGVGASRKGPRGEGRLSPSRRGCARRAPSQGAEKSGARPTRRETRASPSGGIARADPAS